MAKKKNKNKNKNKKNTKKGMGFKGFLLMFFVVLVMVIFTPTTLILLVGMLPTLVAYVVDRSPEKNKTFTIGAMNFAGCFPYLLGLWAGENTVQVSLNYLGNPQTIIIIYMIAGLGYLINWLVTIGVSNILVQKSHLRINRIDKEKQILKDRWGSEVNGKYNLDEHGFPMQNPEEPAS